jgi:hypothetical protein
MRLYLPRRTARCLLALSCDPACEVGQQIDLTAKRSFHFIWPPPTGNQTTAGNWLHLEFDDPKTQQVLQRYFIDARYREEGFQGELLGLDGLLNGLLAAMVVFGHVEMEIQWRKVTSQNTALLLPVYIRLLDPTRTVTLAIGPHVWALTGSSFLGVGSGFGLRVGSQQHRKKAHWPQGETPRPENLIQFILPYRVNQRAVLAAALTLKRYSRYQMQLSHAMAYPTDHGLVFELARMRNYEKEKTVASYNRYLVSALYESFPDEWLTMSPDVTEYYDAWMRRRLALTQISLRKTVVSQINDKVLGVVALKNELPSAPRLVFVRDVSEASVEDLWQQYLSGKIDSSKYRQGLFELTG